MQQIFAKGFLQQVRSFKRIIVHRCHFRTLHQWLLRLEESSCCRQAQIFHNFNLCHSFTSLSPACKNETKISGSESFIPLPEAVAVASTPEEIFRIVDHSSVSNKADLVLIIDALCRITIENVQHFPWALVDDPIMLCVQSLRDRQCRSMVLNSIHRPSFQKLCDSLLKNVNDLTNEELTTVGNSLIWLNVSPGSQMFTDLLTQCMERCHVFSIADLSSLSCLSNRLNRSGFHINGLITQAFQEHDLGQVDLSDETYEQVAQLISNIAFFWSPEFLHHVASTIVNILALPSCGVAPSSSIYFLEALSRFAPNLCSESVRLIVADLHRNIHSLSAWQMSRMLMSLNHLCCLNHPICKDIEKMAMQMLAGTNLSPVDVISLINIMEYVNYPHDSFRILEKLLLVTLNDCDVLLLKTLSQKQFLISSDNSELKKTFVDVVIKQLPNLVHTPSCFLDVIRILTKMNCQQVQLRSLTNVLLNLIQTGHYGNQQDHLVTISQYFLQQASYSCHLPSIILERLLAFLPQYSSHSLRRLNSSMSRLQSPGTPVEIKRHVEFARSLLRRQAGEKLGEDIDTLRSLNATAKSLISFRHTNYVSTSHVQKFAELYSELIPQLDVSSVKNTSDCMRGLKLYVPEALEIMVDVCNEHADAINLNEVTSVLHTVSVLNHLPRNIDRLQDLFVQLCSTNLAQQDTVPVVLLGAFSLATVDLFHEQLIRKIFSVEFLQQFDRYCEGPCRAPKRWTVRNQLRDLNRSTVLMCPQLDIPWFHHTLCQADNDIRTKYRQPGSISKLHLTLKEMLLSLLGSEDYFEDQNVFSEYFHEIDFLCVLNKTKIPLEVQKCKHDAKQTRVAIMLLKQDDYCANKHHLIGPTVAKLRELEILGYKVVTIPYYELSPLVYDRSNSSSDSYLLKKLF